MSQVDASAQDATVVEPDSLAPPVAVKPTKSRTAPGGLRLVLMFGVPLGIAIGGAAFWLASGRYEETDDAYLQQTKVTLNTAVAGRIRSVAVHENQSVNKGDLLFELDSSPFVLALRQATAAVDLARMNVEQLKVAYQGAVSDVAAAQSALAVRQDTYDRQLALVDEGVSASATLDASKLALRQAEAAMVFAQQKVGGATAALGGDPNIATSAHPLVLAALAQLEAAKNDLANTRVTAPADGALINVDNLAVGQFVSAGVPMATLVESRSIWVEANFKETQLAHMHVGQVVFIRVDAYPDMSFAGVVASLGAGTGSELSVIPAQNATGNWVKIVQRLPVRVEFDVGEQLGGLRTGMSATVSTDTKNTMLDRLLGGGA